MNLQEVRNCAGICLTEMLIAMAAGTVVLSATIQTLNHFQQRLWAQHDTIGRHQDQRIGMRVMEGELRLAGTGASRDGAAFVTTDPLEIEFLANLGGFITTLTEAVSSTQQELWVVDGLEWAKGKRILICSGSRCTDGRLSRDGRRNVLSLDAAIGQSFPSGSEVFVSNRVRYYLGKNRSGKTNLMRQVDGGANSIIGDVTSFSLSYVDRVGKPTVDPTAVSRVRVSLGVGEDRRIVTSEVGLRAQ
jgi:hypothetical protein